MPKKIKSYETQEGQIVNNITRTSVAVMCNSPREYFRSEHLIVLGKNGYLKLSYRDEI